MDHVIHTKMSEGRRVAIPAEMCQQYGLEPGDPVVLEPSESGIVLRPLDAVIRETLEETAWHFEPQALLGVYRWVHPAKGLTYMRFAFTGRVTQHETDRTLDDGILRAVWLSPEQIRAERARHRSPLIERCLNDYLAGQRYSLDLIKDLGSTVASPALTSV